MAGSNRRLCCSRAGAIPGVASQPRYVIEWIGAFDDAGTPEDPLPAATMDLFRVTARGTGASGNATAMLQSTFARLRGGGRRALSGRWSFTELGD